MTNQVKSNYDKLLVVLAAATLVVSAGWTWQRQALVRRLRHEPLDAELSGLPYEPANLQLPAAAPAVWDRAPAQSQGSGWLYEVFTPPVIYYNPAARSFTVTPPLHLTEEGTPFNLELLEVKREPYRLQLVGYFGGPGDYLAAFTSPSLPETLLARVGRRFDHLGLTLKSFAVRKVVVEQSDPWPAYDVAALAVLQDEQTGAEVVLDSRARKLTDTPLAVFRLPSGDGRLRNLHEGDTFTADASTYRVERILLDPPEVVVAKETPGLSLPETRILRPAAVRNDAVAGGLANPKTLSSRPPAGLVVNGR